MLLATTGLFTAHIVLLFPEGHGVRIYAISRLFKLALLTYQHTSLTRAQKKHILLSEYLPFIPERNPGCFQVLIINKGAIKLEDRFCRDKRFSLPLGKHEGAQLLDQVLKRCLVLGTGAVAYRAKPPDHVQDVAL